MTDDEVAPVVDELVQRLQSVDPPALGDADTYWAVVIEQIRFGLL